jgi:predicted ATP-dependent Lon-type protease
MEARQVYVRDQRFREAGLLRRFFLNFGVVPEHYLRKYDRLLMGGIWAQVEIRHQYDEEVKGKRSPFWIEELIIASRQATLGDD